MMSGRPVSCECLQNDRRPTARLSDKLLRKACRRLRSRAETHRPALVLAQIPHRLFFGLAFSPPRVAFRTALFLVYGDFLKVEHDAKDWQAAMGRCCSVPNITDQSSSRASEGCSANRSRASVTDRT